MSTFNQNNNNNNNENMEDPDNNFPYSPPCMRCEPVIDRSSLNFHDETIVYPIKIFSDEDSKYNFGVLNISVRGEIPITRKHIHMVFTIDASGSMSDICHDGRTKMAHIHHTLENMLRNFHEKDDCNISVYVQSFDTNVKKVITDVTNIGESDIESLIQQVKKIRPGTSTNIEKALKTANEEIKNYRSINQEHEIIHILLTDGEITEGSRNYDWLLELVPKDCTNIFIGYGRDHDSHLLSHLSIDKGNEYRFIDALERAGLVYGEIIHSILYKAIENVTLNCVNAELYDYKTNTWGVSLQIGNLLSEQIKTFHIRSKTPYECWVSMFGKTIIQTAKCQRMNIYEHQTDIINTIPPSISNLGIYIFRQRTQELLYKARSISEKMSSSKSVSDLTTSYLTTFDEVKSVDKEMPDLIEETKKIKTELTEFHKIMVSYMKENQLENDPILKMLCDDMYIAYKTTGTSVGTMYTCARQTSNGRQQTYMCSITDDTQNLYGEIPRPRLQRQHNQVTFLNNLSVLTSFKDDLDPIDKILENEIDTYAPTQDFLSPFSSGGVVKLMRAVSGNNSIGREFVTDMDEEEETK